MPPLTWFDEHLQLADVSDDGIVHIVCDYRENAPSYCGLSVEQDEWVGADYDGERDCELCAMISDAMDQIPMVCPTCKQMHASLA